MLRKISAALAAGALAGLVSSIIYWYLADAGHLARVGINLHPALDPAWLYARLCWGGIWGGLFLLPILASRPVAQGLLLSLAPTIAALFYFMPHGSLGMLGLNAGPYTPFFVLLLNGVWGLAAAVWYRHAAK